MGGPSWTEDKGRIDGAITALGMDPSVLKVELLMGTSSSNWQDRQETLGANDPKVSLTPGWMGTDEWTLLLLTSWVS